MKNLFSYFKDRWFSGSIEDKMLKAEADERSRELRGNPSWPTDFSPFVETARKRFPAFRCWGQFILSGEGYGLFVTNGLHKSLIQLKSSIRISVDGREELVDNDIRKASQPYQVLRQAFDAVEKSLVQRTLNKNIRRNFVGSKPGR